VTEAQHDHRQLAVLLNQRTWQLLEQSDRSAGQADEMLHAAHGSLWHWLQAGTGVHHQRGVWLVGRVYVELGMAGPALHYARRTLELTEQHKDLLADFDLAFASELAARAFTLTGQIEAARGHRDDAQARGEAIADAADRKLFFEQFWAKPWFGLTGNAGVRSSADP
jgi:hypothetical protein